MLKAAEIAEIFHKTKGFLEGHFQLSSGLHSPNYMQCAKVLQHPQHCERFCKDLAEKMVALKADVVFAPALGGILVGYELARSLNARSIFAERVDGQMTLRRGQDLFPGERVILCEDVVTTGKSIREIEVLAKEIGAEVVGLACIVDRSAGNWKHELPLTSLLQMDLVTYTNETCPMCAQGQELVKPGSRPKP